MRNQVLVCEGTGGKDGVPLLLLAPQPLVLRSTGGAGGGGGRSGGMDRGGSSGGGHDEPPMDPITDDDIPF